MDMEILLGDLPRRNASKFGSKEAIISEDGRWTFREFNSRINCRANALLAAGVQKGDHVATLFMNSAAALEVIFAVLKIGAVVVPLNFRLSAPEMSYLIRNAQASSLIASAEFALLIERLRPELPELKRCFSVSGVAPSGFLDLDHLMKAAGGGEPPVSVRGEDRAFIMYTAGTTGRPKGVVTVHNNWIWSMINVLVCGQIETSHKHLTVYPVFHGAAFLTVFSVYFVGVTLVLLRKFDPQAVLETIQAEKVNRMGFPPTVYNFLLQHPDFSRFDTRSVVNLGSGAEAMPPATRKRIQEHFPQAGIFDTYGMTETCASITALRPMDPGEKTTSVGKPLVNVEVGIVDEEDRFLPAGEVGEIVCRGPNLMVGYFQNPEATQRAVRQGWFHTGDMGKMDEEGYVYIVDRKDDMIISGGENIYPKEVESILQTHSKILEVAVIPRPDPMWVQRVHAVVVVKPGESLKEEEVMAYCEGKIASFKKPRSVSFLGALPRSAAGKVLKRELTKKEG